MNKEKLKSLLLVFMIITSVVLTQRVWYYSPLQILSPEASYLDDTDELLMEARAQVIRPKRMVAGFGGGTENSYYAILTPSDLEWFWQESQVILMEHFLLEPSVQVVSYDEYRRVRGSRSIELHFGENFPSALLSILFDQQENQVAGVMNQIKTILIPARYQGIIYLTDETDTVHEFRLRQAEIRHDSDPGVLLDSLPVNSYVKYYPLFSYVGNETLLPLTYQLNKPRLFTESEIDAGSVEQMNRWAGRFFSENFDFVKTIQETGGTRIYMYGYGQQEVRINNRGRLEYSAETGNQSSSSVGRSLDAALLFMAAHNGLNHDLTLKEVRLLEVDDNRRGYLFGFGYSLRDLPVELERNQHAVEIEVFGSKISSYRTFTRRAMGLPEVMPDEGILPPHRLIEDNFSDLLDEMNEAVPADEEASPPEEAVPDTDGAEPEVETSAVTSPEVPTVEMLESALTDSEIAGEDLLRAIQNIELVYLDREETNRRELMIPAWRITIGQRIYYFDAHEGVRLHSVTLSGRDV